MHFVFFVSHWNVDSGGVSVMYELARRLSLRGTRVSVWIWGRPLFTLSFFKSNRWRLGRIVKDAFRYYRRRKEIPFGLQETLYIDGNCVAVYPEVINGNPLGTNRVARWILFYPGLLSKLPAYEPTDDFFHWSATYRNELVPKHSFRLRLPLLQLHLYRNLGLPRSNEVLVLVRKGRERSLNMHPPNAIAIDGKSHEELCRLFNTSKFLFSYDAYTAYLTYAAVCGCIPVVLPLKGVSETDWLPDPEDRLGVAYGVDRVGFARETRALLIERLKRFESEASEDIENFLLVFSS